MSFTDEIVPSIVFQHILRKQRFGIKSHNAGFEAMVSGLNIAVTVIDTPKERCDLHSVQVTNDLVIGILERLCE